MVVETRLHFIGIGGYGMSALAYVAHERGMSISGSDERASERTERLQRLGIPVAIGHAPEHVTGAEAVVYSTDVPASNPELQAASDQGCTILHRSQVLAHFLNPGRGVAITGTHGKTTTTAMIGLICLRAGLDPTVILGGEADYLQGNARAGQGPVVAEACESDGSFLRYHPEVAVVTNLEPEHLDHYGGEFWRLRAAMRGFLDQVKSGGCIVASTDDPELSSLIANGLSARVVTFGLKRGALFRATAIKLAAGGATFTLWEGGKRMGQFRLQVPGIHNVCNALAAIAASRQFDIPYAVIRTALTEYAGAKRRFQVVGSGQGITVVDDYAHHPTEIRATLRAARAGGGRVLAVFQPQRYTRTYYLLDQFGEAFADADELVLTNIYSPPGETPIAGVTGDALAQRVAAGRRRPVQRLDDHEEIADYLLRLARPGDLILTMGAGDIWKVAVRVADRLKTG